MITKVFENIVLFMKNHTQRSINDFRYMLSSTRERREKFDTGVRKEDQEEDEVDLVDIPDVTGVEGSGDKCRVRVP